MNLTNRMMMILDVVMKRNPDGSLVDLDQLIERVEYDVTKAAIQFTIRNMVNNGLIKKETVYRRDRNRVVYRPTGLAYQVYTAVS